MLFGGEIRFDKIASNAHQQFINTFRIVVSRHQTHRTNIGYAIRVHIFSLRLTPANLVRFENR